MKFTLSWLKKHLDTSANLDEILTALTDLGLEVENVEDPAESLKEFTIGKVVSAEQHPNADKLRVCQVQTDEGELQIICGAPNARKGILVVVAKPGVFVPGIETTIGVGNLLNDKTAFFEKEIGTGKVLVTATDIFLEKAIGTGKETAPSA